MKRFVKINAYIMLNTNYFIKVYNALASWAMEDASLPEGLEIYLTDDGKRPIKAVKREVLRCLRAITLYVDRVATLHGNKLNCDIACKVYTQFTGNINFATIRGYVHENGRNVSKFLTVDGKDTTCYDDTTRYYNYFKEA